MDKDIAKRYDSGGCPRAKLFATNWLEGISDSADTDTVEVTFKNTRNGFFSNPSRLPLKIGNIVAVEASPGHDIGRVSMVGRLVALQMKKNGAKPDAELKRVFRLATQADIEKYEEARSREHDTMIRTRKIAEELDLNMKIGDVEFQGDGQKAIFYYIADERVDFRKLIRILADTFKIRVEMKQIGARQEAGRIGGIGPCGRPLCCSSWMTHFVSVGTGSARLQDLSMNPQKLAGQCAKLKCCLNFEVDVYSESHRQLPAKDIQLETKDNTYYFFKADILARKITYSTDKKIPANLVTIDASRAFEIIALNKQGVKPDTLEPEEEHAAAKQQEYVDLVEQESLTRFDKSKKKKKKKPAKAQNAPADGKRPEESQNRQPEERKSQAAPQKQSKPGNGAQRSNNERPNGNHPNGERPNGEKKNRRPKPAGKKKNPAERQQNANAKQANQKTAEE